MVGDPGLARRSPMMYFALALSAAWAIPAPPAAAAVVLDRHSAVAAVVSELALGGITVAWCPYADYGAGAGFEGVLPSATTIRPVHLGTLPYPGNVVTLAGPTYLFMVDEEPEAGFTHRVRYALVDATVAVPSLAAGTIVVQEQGWWPVIERPGMAAQELFGADDRISALAGAHDNPDGLVFGTFVTALPARRAEGERRAPPDFEPFMANHCAIVATGVPAGAPGTAEAGATGSADDMYQQLLNRGIPAGRIQNIRNTNRAGLRNAVTALCALNPGCDKIWVYIGSHGSNGGINLGDSGSVTDEELCAVLKPLGRKGVPVCLMIEACYSGSLAYELRNKFPRGTLLFSSRADQISWASTVTGQGDYGLFYYAFRQCWNSAAADSDGSGFVDWAEAFRWVCNGDNGKVTSRGRVYDVKSHFPEMRGLPTTVHGWKDADTGITHRDEWRDLDQDGAFDRCELRRDLDGDGIKDAVYTTIDADEDSTNEVSECIRDVDDDGVPDIRYVALDPEDDGVINSLTCYTWNGSNWVENINAPLLISVSFTVNGNIGSRAGERPFQLVAPGPQWFNPNVVVFIGSQAHNVQVVNPTLIQGVTSSFLTGTTPVLVADFNPASPGFGFSQAQNVYRYTPEMFVNFVLADHTVCDQPIQLTIDGGLFDPAAQVFADGVALPTTWVDAATLEAEIPSSLCPGPTSVASGDPVGVSVTVENPDFGLATLVDAFGLFQPKDDFPPSITCPMPLLLEAGPDGLARMPASFQANANDGEGGVVVVRNDVGALGLGTHAIVFEAIDEAAQRTTCDAEVIVGISGVPGAIPGAFFLAPGSPNPFLAETSIRFGLPHAANVTLGVYTITGQRVALLENGTKPAGIHNARWRAVRDDGRPLESGVYFVRMKVAGREFTQRISLLR